MAVLVGIRREDKNEWERRVPLNPTDLADLQREHPVHFRVQPSAIRIYTDAEFRQAGIEVDEDLSPARIVLAVKEIPVELLQPKTTYVYFSHVIKGQDYNMPMLRRLLELGCSLIDYERIADLRGRRLIFFSLHAGYAGMIETLWCLGRRLAERGYTTPYLDVKHAYEYASLAEAKEHLGEVGRRITREGLPVELTPLVIGLAGYGNVSVGCQEILDWLQVPAVEVAELADAAARGRPDAPSQLRVVFKEEDMVRPRQEEAEFALQDYYDHPEHYQGCFADHLPHLDVLMNTIYWDDRYPRLVTRDWVARNYGKSPSARLQVIGDISCDIEGGVQITLEATHPDSPCYVFAPDTGRIQAGVRGEGPVVMAVDNLPCELPRESSDHFSNVLRGMVPDLVAADWEADFEDLVLPPHLKDAVIAHHGRLTPAYTYLEEHLDS